MTSEQGYTPDESATVATVLVEPTLRRMQILLSTLIANTQNADFAALVPIVLLSETLIGLDYTQAPRLAAARLTMLASRCLAGYAGTLAAHAVALSSLPADAPTLAPPAWTDQDTREAYASALLAYPDPVVAGNDEDADGA